MSVKENPVRIENPTRFFFKYQGIHMAAGIGLAALTWFAVAPKTLPGDALRISTETWFNAALIVAIVHQTYVWVMWRSELCWSWVSRNFSFPLYRVGFVILFLSRFAFVILLAIADTGSLFEPTTLSGLIAGLLFLPAAYTLYSVARYFGFSRATGADHFDPEYRIKPFVRKGIFRLIPNAMYTLAMLLFWSLAIAAGSKATLAVAIYYHLIIWVHYFCTERPDMDVIYGDALETLKSGTPCN
jgi:magnesium-transporting ATPase (P-type)